MKKRKDRIPHCYHKFQEVFGGRDLCRIYGKMVRRIKKKEKEVEKNDSVQTGL